MCANVEREVIIKIKFDICKTYTANCHTFFSSLQLSRLHEVVHNQISALG